MKPTALLVDGTALFLATRSLERGKPLDYFALQTLILRESGIEARGTRHFDLRLFFTSNDPSNEKQANFHDFVERKLEWSVDAVRTAEAVVTGSGVVTLENGEQRPYVRFDSRIAFCLGRLAGQYSHVVVVSDSYPLAAPMLETVQRQTEVTLAFFGQVLDPRWGKHLHRAGAVMNWIDLDQSTAVLFGGERQLNESTSGLRHLP